MQKYPTNFKSFNEFLLFFSDKIKQNGECLEWHGAIDSNRPYIKKEINKTKIWIRNIIWTFNQPLQSRYTIMNFCGNNKCIAFDHLISIPFKKTGPVKLPIEKRFWKFIKKTPTCWIWLGNKLPYGYGIMGDYKKGKHSTLFSHRISYEIHNGPIPEGIHVLHNCPGGDNPSCCNPAHLFLGTQLDNVHDMYIKGRGIDGEKHYRARLTEHKVKQIRKYYETGMRQCDLMRMFKIKASHIFKIISCKIWKHI